MGASQLCCVGCLRVFMCVRVCSCVCVCACVRMRVRARAHVHVCVCVYTHRKTNTHAQKKSVCASSARSSACCVRECPYQPTHPPTRTHEHT